MIPDHLNFPYLKRQVSIVTVRKHQNHHGIVYKKGRSTLRPLPCPWRRQPQRLCCQPTQKHDAMPAAMSSNCSDAFLCSLADTAESYQSLDPVHYRKIFFTPFTAPLRLDASTPWLHKKPINTATASRFETGAYQDTGFLSSTGIHRINLPSGLDPHNLTDAVLLSATEHFFL